MNNVDAAVEHLIGQILQSDTYLEYCKALKKVKQEPGLKEQIDEFRARNYEIQNGSISDLCKVDQLEREYEEFRENALVEEFLSAELAFCRMMQEINLHITEALHFE